MTTPKKPRASTFIEIAAQHGWCSWPVPKAIREEQEQLAEQHARQLEQLIAEIEAHAAAEAKAERLRQEHGPDTRVEHNGDGTITIIEGH